MSEVTTLALPVPNNAAFDGNARSHARSHAPTAAVQSFAFATQRWQYGLTQAVGGTSLAVMGAFLLTQIGSTPGLTTQLAILGSICAVGGVALLTKAARDLFGRLVIDQNGITLRPGFAGFTISWNELKRWQVQLEGNSHPSSPSIRLWTQVESCPLFIPNSWLSDHDRDQIRHAMYSHAADKCMTDRHSFGQ